MCVVKVKRVESDSVGLSNKELLHNTSPVKTDLKAQTDAYIDSHPFCESREINRTVEDSGQWPKATQSHPGTDDLQCFSSEQDGFLTSQHIKDLSPEDKKMHLVLLTASTSDSEVSVGPSDPEMQTSRKQDSSSQTPVTDDSMDTGTENIQNRNSAKLDLMCDLKPITPQCNTGALLSSVQTKPVGVGSSTSFHTHSPSGSNCSLEKNSTEENIFPPLLQRSSIDMPLLTPEPEDKTSMCLLPPVLTQEMPSLTPAHDGLPNVSRPASCTNQVAPVLQREMPTSSLSLQPAKQKDEQTECVTPEHASSWHLGLLYNCEVTAMPGSHGNSAHLSASFTHNTTSGVVHDMRNKPEIATETGHTERNNVRPEHKGASPHQLVQGNASQSEQDYSSTKLTSTDNLDHLGLGANAMSLTSAGSLLTSASDIIPLPPSPSLCTGAVSHSDSELHHSPAYSHCISSTTYTEPKPFSNRIWKNLNSHSSAVLIQSLNPELSSDYTHDPLPYTIWTEPQCKEVTDLESSEHELHLSEHQEEEDRPLTWAQLEPTSLVSVDAVEPLELFGDVEPQRGEVEKSEALPLTAELGRRIEDEKILKSGTVVSTQLIGEHHKGESDLEEGACDAEEAEKRCQVREEESSDLSDEEEVEEAFSHNYQCAESGLEPGEIRAVSAHLCAVAYLVKCINVTK